MKTAQLPFEEIQTLDEVMAEGTAALLLPIRSIFRPSTQETVVYQGGSDVPGPACRILRKAIDNIMHGRIKDRRQWVVLVIPASETDESTSKAVEKGEIGIEIQVTS
jgi:branched-chain amino acid aminotransferase